MLIIFLASVLGGETHAVQPAEPRNIQQVAIDTITGKAPMAQPSPAVRLQADRPGDPQAEIVARITGRNVTYPAASGRTDKVVDPQAAIVRSITGRK